MRKILLALLAQFEIRLRERAVPNSGHGSYKKWLHFYLDFCEKYHFLESKSENLAHFLHKLEEKRQTEAQQQKASRAVSLFYKLIHSIGSHDELASPKKVLSSGKVPDESPHPSDSSLNHVADPDVITSQGEVHHKPHLPSPFSHSDR
jgi:hypothetical protein